MESIFIFSAEPLFSKMLLYELEDRYDVTVCGANNKSADGADLIIFDADDDALFPNVRRTALLAYGLKEREHYGLSEKTVFFHRPFSVSEFKAEIERMLSSDGDEKPESIRFSYKNVCVNNEKINLTETEYAVLSYLYGRRGEVVTREELKRVINKNKENAAASNCADVYISFLRNKIEKPYGRRFIKTVRGKGYCLI